MDIVKSKVIACFVFVFCLIWPLLLYAETPEKNQTILITPFRFYAAQDVAFLNHGILEMLATRLPKQGNIKVKEWSKAPYDEAEAAVWAQKQGTDYVLIGSVVIFDGNVSTDARLIKAANGDPVLLFSRFGRRPGDILYHVDILAKEIAKILERP